MRKILLVLSIGLLASGCILPIGLPHPRHPHVVVSHTHGHACGHVFVDGVWIVVH